MKGGEGGGGFLLSYFLLTCTSGFPTGAENMGGSSKFVGGGGRLESIHGGRMDVLKMVLKNTCEGVH